MKRIRKIVFCMILICTLAFSNMFTMTSEAATSTGWKHNKNGWWYVYSTSGAYYKNTWHKISGKWYYFKANGYMAAKEYINGYWLNPNGSWTYYPVAKWKKNSTGWWFGDTAKWYAKNGNYKINGVTYHFNRNGYYGADWKQENNNWYYYKANGTFVTGLVNISNKYYFFDKTGKMLTGWITNNGHKYYFNNSGERVIGWQTIGKNTYYFNTTNGYMSTGWQTIGGNKYYFLKNGIMKIGWQTINNNKYYFTADGKMNTKSELKIDGKIYTFDKNGVCLGEKESTDPSTEDPIGGDDPIIVDPPTPSHTHTWETVAAKEPTCTEIGWTEYKKCTDCDKIEGYTEISALGHDMKSEVIAPTCTTNGYTKHWCDRCDTVFENTDIIEAIGHDFTEIHKYSDEACTNEITEVSCDQSYWYKKKCTICGSWTEAEYHNAGEHFWSDWTVSKEATCKEDGEETRTCQNCGKKETRTISKETVAHTYTDNWTVSKAATCAEDGEEERFCTVCGEGRETRTISTDPDNHYYKISDMANVRQNGEDEFGNIVYVATTCNPNLPTYWSEECEWCHNEVKHTVDHLDHDFNGERKYYTDKDCTQEVTGNFNCEKTYYYKTKCINCDTWSDVETKLAGKHSYKVSATYEATCKEKGYTIYTCDICENEYIEYKEKKPHNFTGEVKYYEDEACTIEAPEQLDCETTYYYKTKCINCDTWSDVNVKEAGQHNWIDDTSKEDIKSTCKTLGTHYKKCSICSKHDTDPIALDPDNHEGEEVSDNNAVAATCRKTGKTASTHCSVCGSTIKAQQTTPKDPNNHTNWLDDDGDGDPVYSRDRTYYILDDDLVEELNLPKNKYYADEIDISDDKYHYNEIHWWASDPTINKYFVQDYASYGTTPIDVTWYWRKALGVELNRLDYNTWLIPQNPLIIAGAANNNMTPEAYTELLIDYYENHYYMNVTNFITIEGICQDGLAGNTIECAYNPSGNGNGIVHIRRYTAYTEHHNYKYCKDCKTEFEVEAAPDEIFDNQISGTIMGYTHEYS